MCQCSHNIDKCACAIERERERGLADKKANGVIHDRSTNNNKNNKNNNKMCASDGKYGIQILINNLMRLWRVSTKDYVAHSPCYIYSIYVLYTVYSNLYGNLYRLISVRLISVLPAAFAISLSLLSNETIRSYVT